MDRWFPGLFSQWNFPNDSGRNGDSIDERTKEYKFFGSLDPFFNQGPSYSGEPSSMNLEGNDSSQNSPRDSMLKNDAPKNKNNSILKGSISDTPEGDLRNREFSDDNGNFFFGGKQDDGNSDPFHGEFGSEDASPFSFSFRIMDPFGMMNEMMRSFENFGGLDENPFPNFDGPSIGLDMPDHERRDKDLDSSEDNARLLLKEDPGHGGHHNNTVAPEKRPFSHSFKSTSIVRICKPDGTIEETKKYTDSTGVEKITVTTNDPQEGDTQLRLKDDDRNFGNFPQKFGSFPQNPNFGAVPQNPFSIFSWFR